MFGTQGDKKEGLGSNTSYDCDIRLPHTNSSPVSSANAWMHLEMRCLTKTFSSIGSTVAGCHWPKSFSQALSSLSWWVSSSFSEPEEDDSLNSSPSMTSSPGSFKGKRPEREQSGKKALFFHSPYHLTHLDEGVLPCYP